MNTPDIVSEIALSFVSDEDFDDQMNQALAVIGRRLGISRCYLFLDSADGATTSNTHEWCAPGIEPQIDQLQNIPYADLSAWREMLKSADVNPVSDVGTLAPEIRAILEPQGIKSLIIASMCIENRPRGFLGFDECTRIREWTAGEQETLRTAVRIIRTAFTRMDLARRLAASEENFKSFFNTVDDINVIGDLEGNLLHVNDATSRKLGYSLEELRGKNILDIHPEDKRAEAAVILQSMFRKERDSCPLEIQAKDGTRVPVETRIWFGQWDNRPCIFGVSKDLSAEQSALQKFERLFRNNPAAMAISRKGDRVFLDVNDAFLDIFGYSRQEVIGASSRALNLFVDDERWQAAKDELIQSGAIRNWELALRKKDGSLIFGLFSGDTIRNQGEDFLLTVMVDITAQKNLQKDLETERARLENIIEGTRLGTWEWNVQTGETVFNEQWAAIVGYTLAELAPVSIASWSSLVHPDDLAESGRLLDLHFRGITDYYDFEARMRHKDGSWVWVHDRGKVIERDGDGKPVKMYGTHADITEKRRLEEQIRDLAIRDPLTNVYNRRYLFSRLDTIMAESSRGKRSFCVSIFDIDHFKAVNDTYGHLAGDYVLKEFVAVVAAMIRQYDLVGRYGGEEFIIVAPGAVKADIASMIERIMARIRGTAFTHDGREIRCTFSAGLADSTEFGAGEFTVEDLLLLVDRRLYEAKARGRDRCVWN